MQALGTSSEVGREPRTPWKSQITMPLLKLRFILILP
jgi:hypothetical protein